jgi:hypothetical protein
MSIVLGPFDIHLGMYSFMVQLYVQLLYVFTHKCPIKYADNKRKGYKYAIHNLG